MFQTFLPRILPTVLGWCVFLQTGCTFPDPQEVKTAPSLSLQGRWRQDSGHVMFYDRRGQFLHRLEGDSGDPTGLMTIGTVRWRFWDGRNRAAFSYTRRGDTLILLRLADSALVRGGHAQWEDLGTPIGLPDTSLISCLTARSWVLLDSARHPDGSDIRVARTYYSR